MRPMDGVKVVELGIWVAAPAAGAILADWGADVIKVESPSGDPMRSASLAALPPGVRADPIFEPDNRGKRSLVLNLREDVDRERLYALLESADVFLTNIRAAGLQRLGITPEMTHQRNPRLIYAIFSAYGLEGPDADVGAYDLGAFWARSGIAHLLTVPGGLPPIPRTAMGDHPAAVTVAAMISAALFQRERTQHGQVVSTSLLRVAAYHIASDLNAKLMIDRDPGLPDRREMDNPLWNNYAASDGRRFWLMSPAPDRNWPVLARIVGRPEWAENPRYHSRAGRAANSAALIAELDQIFAAAPYERWRDAFEAEPDFFWAPVRTIDEVLADPQTAAAGTFIDVETAAGAQRQIASPVDFHHSLHTGYSPSPALGQHTADIVTALDRSPSEWPCTASAPGV